MGQYIDNTKCITQHESQFFCNITSNSINARVGGNYIMTRLSFSILISVFCLSCFGQTTDSLNISLWTPPSWFSADKKLLHNNLNNYKFSNDQINQLVNDINTSTVLGVYYKYDPKVHSGLVPTIKFYVRQNNINDFEKFFLSIKTEIENVKSKVLFSLAS